MIRRQVGPRRHLALYLIMSFFVLSAFGCGSGGGGSSSDSTPTTPVISTQGVLDFGTVVIPDSPSRILTIANDGTADLNIGTISLQQPTGTPFTIINDNCSNKSIAPSGTCSVGVQFSTTATSPQDDQTNTLSIPSNDSASNPLTLAMAGKVRKFLVSINEIIKSSCPSKILQLLVSVSNNVGAAVDNLLTADFTVYENDPNLTNRKTIISPVLFQTPPIAVAILLDYSTSILDKTPIEDAAKAFVDQLKSTDLAGVAKFGRTLQPLSFTGGNFIFADPTGKAVLKNTIEQPFVGDANGTILYDAVFAAVNAVDSPSVRPRAVVVLSDGEDQFSTMTLDETIDNAFSKGIPVFTIATTLASDPQPEILRRLAEETGGTYFEAASNADVQKAYLQIAGILSNQYLIEYQTASGSGDIVSLDVFVNQGTDKGEASRDAVGCP